MLAGAQPLLLVGAGKMGGAMLERWLAAGLAAAAVTILDPYLEGERWAELAKAGVATARNAAEAGDRAYKIIVLAVKPQSMAEALPQIAGARGAGHGRSSRSPPACGSRRSKQLSRKTSRSCAPCPTRRRRSA